MFQKYSSNFNVCQVVREVCCGSLLSASIPSWRTQEDQLWLSLSLVSRKLAVIGYIDLYIHTYLLSAHGYYAAMHTVLSN